MNELAVAAKLEDKYDGVPAILAGKDPALAPLERIWKTLTAASSRASSQWHSPSQTPNRKH
jgi:hypothetical protein